MAENVSDSVHILVCDDEPDIRDMMSTYLQRRGYTVSMAENGAALDRILEEHDDIQLIILDINMPGEDGLSVLRRLRTEMSLPIIMSTAAGDTVDRVVGLELGADDYLAKPVDLRELEARIKAVLRRGGVTSSSGSEAPKAEGDIVVDGLTINIEGAKLTGRDGQGIPLTAMEFSLLRAFVEHRGRVLNRDQILQMAHDRDWDPFDRSIDIRISRLRRKIERNPSHPVLIRTVRGLGYIFDQAD
ncbi:MAG: response regulator [Hyphomonadaceae bacterium]|nr:response regulator [Hyphomonadaceae bacterium]